MLKFATGALALLCTFTTLFCQDTVIIPKGSVGHVVLHNQTDSASLNTPKSETAAVYKTFSFNKYSLPFTTDSWFTSVMKYFKGSANYIYPDDYVIVKSDAKITDTNVDSFRLWIDGVCFTQLKPLHVNEQDCTFIFQLSYDTARTSPWKLFYAWPGYTTIHHPITMSLGTLQTEYKGATSTVKSNNINPIELRTSVPWMIFAGYLLFIGLMITAVKMKKGLLKNPADCIKKGIRISFDDKEKTNAAAGVININDLQFSLSRAQFLFWLIIIFFSIIHIWVITDTLAIPNGSVLLLIGVSGGTFYISRLIDFNSAKKEEADVNAPTPQEEVEQFLKNKQQSKGFLQDILNDGAAISLHRLQLVVFTLFLGLYFIWQVIYGLNLPYIDATMLLLMGISSGTYAGMKTSE